jgi:PAS domain S-box-containing protein
MSALLLVLLLAAGYFTYQRQERFILYFALENARGFARQLVETRNYMSQVEKGEPEQNYALVPQVVATEVAKRVTGKTKYYLRQVSLRYRNPGNRPDPYESAHLRAFATHPRETYEVVKVGEERYFRYLQPMIASASCLQCHGSYESAPDFIQRRFPRGHYSYNYRVGEVIGAVSVSIPVKDLYASLGTSLKVELAGRAAVFILVVTMLGAVLRRQIVDPVTLVSERIVRVTQTGQFGEKLPQRTHDEIGKLIGAFNDLMEELDNRTVQSAEANERYRRLIELTGSAVVTFLADGRILIVNQKAEALFGRSKNDLLGESIYTLIAEGETLKEQLRDERGLKEEGLSRQVISGGRKIDVEIAVAASQTDREPMYTAILREKG